MTSTPTRPVENVVLRTKGLQERNTQMLTINYPSQETEETSTPTRHVENVVLTMKGIQERKTQMLVGTTVEK